MRHFWTREQIMARLDIASTRTLARLIKVEGLPVFKRKRGRNLHEVLYSNDALITLWELAKAKAYRESLAEYTRPTTPRKPAALKAV